MKIYEIYDEENDMSLGILMYYEKSKGYVIELQSYLDEWSAPLLFSKYVKENIYTIPSDVSFLWVKERVIPSGRQNINDILKRHNLKEYDEMKFLEIAEGRCSQDSICIKKLERLPDYVEQRMEKNIVECVATDDKKLLCIFADDKIKRVDVSELTYVDDVDKIIKNTKVFESAKIGLGGFSVVFNDTIELSARLLYKEGNTIPLSMKDIRNFVEKNIYDTSECCELLGCTRQNMSYMVNEKQITPIKENVKGNLYLKGDVIKNTW